MFSYAYAHVIENQGCGTPSEDREEERMHQGALQHPCQRWSALGHPVYIGRHQRQFHAAAVKLFPGRHTCHRQGLHRLCQVRRTDTARSILHVGLSPITFSLWF